MNMKVSIITPMYNSALYIEETIQSVLSQTLSEWEMIIVDNHSSDESCRIVERYVQNDPRIKLIRNHCNSGAAEARNKGMDIAQGAYIAFLDSDDFWYPTFLEDMYSFSSENNYSFCYASYQISINTLSNIQKEFTVPAIATYESMLKVCVISCLTAFIRRELVADTRMEGKINEDYFFWLALLKKTSQAHGHKPALAIYRLRPNSASRNKLEVAYQKWVGFRTREQISFWRSVYYFSYYFWHGFKKYAFSFNKH